MIQSKGYHTRTVMAGKAGKVWSLPRFWVSMRSYKKQPVKTFLGRILDLAWLKFAVAALVFLTAYLVTMLEGLSLSELKPSVHCNV